MKLSFKTADCCVPKQTIICLLIIIFSLSVRITDALIAYQNLKQFMSHSEDKININEPISIKFLSSAS